MGDDWLAKWFDKRYIFLSMHLNMCQCLRTLKRQSGYGVIRLEDIDQVSWWSDVIPFYIVEVAPLESWLKHVRKRCAKLTSIMKHGILNISKAFSWNLLKDLILFIHEFEIRLFLLEVTLTWFETEEYDCCSNVVSCIHDSMCPLDMNISYEL